MPGRDHLTLKLYDILAGKDVWSKDFDAKALVLQSDDANLTGVLEPSGKVIALDANTGAELLSANIIHGRVTLDEINGVKEPLLLRDADHFYVMLNKPINATKVAHGCVANNFNNNLRCAPVNGWVVALHGHNGQRRNGNADISWKVGDFAWHSYMPLRNQLVVLEQFADLPVLLFSARVNELINGGTGGIRWLATTQSIDKRTGKVIYDPGARTINGTPQFAAFNVDRKNGTINMIGWQAILQHYIDDGRTPTDAPGVIKGSAASLNSARRQLNQQYGEMPLRGGFGLMPAFPANNAVPIRRVPVRVQPLQRD